jgi:hypothetical protein
MIGESSLRMHSRSGIAPWMPVRQRNKRIAASDGVRSTCGDILASGKDLAKGATAQLRGSHAAGSIGWVEGDYNLNCGCDWKSWQNRYSLAQFAGRSSVFNHPFR